MPTYEYACRSCGHNFDIVQSMTEAALQACPECGGSLRKIFHPAGIAFKGSGFYATDSRKKPTSSPAKASAASESGGSTGGTKDSASAEGGGSKGDAGSKDGAKPTPTPKASPTKEAPAKSSKADST